MASRIDLPEELALLKHQVLVIDDFHWYLSPHLWTSLAVDGGAAVAIVQDGTGGLVRLTTGATDNNEAAVKLTNEVFLLAAGKPFRLGTRMQFAELAANAANVAFGAADDFGKADTLLDNGGGVGTFTTALIIYTVDGGGTWRLHTENGDVTEAFTSVLPAGGAAFVDLEIFARPVATAHPTNPVLTDWEVTYMVNGGYFYDSAGRIVQHRISHTDAGEMNFGVYAKTGAASSLVVDVDYLYAVQKR